MLNKATIDNIAGTLGLNAEELATGITSEEEVNFDIKEGRFLSSEEVETIKDNHGKTRYDAGATASREMQLKDMSKLVGFDKSITDPQKFIDAFKVNILEDAKIEPDKKLSEMETSISNLQAKITEKDEDYSRLQVEVTKNKLKFDVKAFIPNIPDSLGISKDDATNLFFLSREVKDDGVYKDGVVLKSDMEIPLTLKESVDAFITDKGWIIKPSGRGGGSGAEPNGAVPKTMEDFEAVISKKGWEIGSAESNALLQEIATKNPEILD